MNKEIINNLKKEVCDIRIDVKKSFNGYKQKEISLWYSVKNSLLDKRDRNKNNFYFEAGEETVDELMKKDQMELFELLATKHLEKNKGFGEVPKQFKTPCYVCNQRSLTTLGWSEEGYLDDLERFFCRLCRTSFGWIDIKDDPLELQKEMIKYYLIFTEKDIEISKKRLDEANKEFVDIREYLSSKQKLLVELQTLL